MTEQHPITPSTELLDQWCMSSELGNWRDIAICAAQWGSDRELEACCEWLKSEGYSGTTVIGLRDRRRPKPLSLKEQALALVEQLEEGCRPSTKDWDAIRRALEALDD